jgi:hypothetical protein
MSLTDAFFSYWSGSHHVNDEGGDQVVQAESMVEPLGVGREVGLGLLAELQRFVCFRARMIDDSFGE